MRFITAAHTDVGLVKQVNQDSLLIQQARTDLGPVLLAVLCDGMGGLSMGEVASACMVRYFSEWFEQELPLLLQSGFERETLRASWDLIVREGNFRIRKCEQSKHVSMGTTCVALLLVGDSYYLMNVGDSRAYLISDNIYQLTKDQTLVQREVDEKRITYEQSLTDPRRNVLLQCIGAGAPTVPDYFFGKIAPNQCFMLCCDGFRHLVQPKEFFEHLNPTVSVDAETMTSHLVYLVELNKQRQETDNITAALIKVCE